MCLFSCLILHNFNYYIFVTITYCIVLIYSVLVISLVIDLLFSFCHCLIYSRRLPKMNIFNNKAETEVSALTYKMIIMKKHYGAKDSLFGISQL